MNVDEFSAVAVPSATALLIASVAIAMLRARSAWWRRPSPISARLRAGPIIVAGALRRDGPPVIDSRGVACVLLQTRMRSKIREQSGNTTRWGETWITDVDERGGDAIVHDPDGGQLAVDLRGASFSTELPITITSWSPSDFAREFPALASSIAPNTTSVERVEWWFPESRRVTLCGTAVEHAVEASDAERYRDRPATALKLAHSDDAPLSILLGGRRAFFVRAAVALGLVASLVAVLLWIAHLAYRDAIARHALGL